MKRTFLLFLCCILTVMMVLPASAISLTNSEGTDSFDVLPGVYNDATFVSFADFWEEGATNARHGGNAEEDFDYVYLKADDLGDFTVPFTVEEDGEYLFGVFMMGWTASVTRTTNVKIDDSEWIYIKRDYVEDDQFKHDYSYGYSVYLTKGEHTVTLSLADDFDDSTVKSLYFCDFFYILNPVQPEPEVPEEVQEPAPAPEDAEPEAPAEAGTAPETADASLLPAAAILCAAAAAAVLSMKKKNR